MVKESSYKNQFQVEIDTEKDTPKENNNSYFTWQHDMGRRRWKKYQRPHLAEPGDGMDVITEIWDTALNMLVELVACLITLLLQW
jgi:hypothetical protein